MSSSLAVTLISKYSAIASVAGASLVLGFLGLLIYRIWFHPLAHIPGPWMCKVSGLYDFFICLGEKRHENFERLFKIYGPVVRFGPNEIVFNTASAFQELYGFKSNSMKSDALAAASTDPDLTSTFTEPDRKRAQKKRQILSYGFSENALRSSEAYIIDRINLMCNRLVDPATERVKDMSKWLNYLAYDIMGEIVFGRGFDMLVDEQLHYILPLIDNMVFSFLLGGALPWLHKSGLINLFFPTMGKKRQMFVKYCQERVLERVGRDADSEKAERKDFFYWLLRARDPETGKPLSRKALITEGTLLILAGSDTTSTGLAAALFYILQNPPVLKRLREELDDNFTTVDQIRTGASLSRCVYLKAIVEESLRMAPPGPGIAPRTILKGGQIIDGVFVPEGYTIGVSKYALGQNERYFPEPHVFKPERYLQGGEFSDEEVERAKNSYWVFSLGPRKCPGLKMAYQELYLTIARLVYLFDITPEKPEELKKNFQMLDHFNVKKFGPYVSFKLREGRQLPSTTKTELGSADASSKELGLVN